MDEAARAKLRPHARLTEVADRAGVRRPGQVDDEGLPPGTAALAHGSVEVAAAAHPVRVGKHPVLRRRLRRRVRRDPCAGVPR